MHDQSNLWKQHRLKTHRVVFFIILYIVSNLVEVSRSDYVNIEDSCAEYDSCEKTEFFRTCSCDEDCSRYGICCWNALAKNKYPLEQFECYSKDISQAVFVKQSCNPSYAGDSDIIALCEDDQQDWSDLMANVLVSSNKTSTTYKNWNCAICNNEKTQNLWFWTVQASYSLENLEKRLNLKSFRSNFVFNDTIQKWGVYDNGHKFISCPLKFYQPAHLHDGLRYCAGNVISSCPSIWENEFVREKCNSYYGERKQEFSKTYYKNVYCALCNGLDVADLYCNGRHYDLSTSLSNRMVMNVIYNLNPWTGEHTDSYKTCESGFRYDPFLKTCRNIACGLKHPDRFTEYCKASGSNTLSTSCSICILLAIICLIAIL